MLAVDECHIENRGGVGALPKVTQVQAGHHFIPCGLLDGGNQSITTPEIQR